MTPEQLREAARKVAAAAPVATPAQKEIVGRLLHAGKQRAERPAGAA